jgi:uncharacterized protein RhaS with RHS repeats
VTLAVPATRNQFGGETGSSTQQDPIGIAGGANVYGFAGGDPVNLSDPFGLCPPPGLICKLILEFVAREAARPSMNNPALANVEQSPEASVLHTMGKGGGNKKFLSADGHHESVRSPEGSEVTDENAATYNYGESAVGHLFKDVLPWIVVGTHAPNDKTTALQRARKMLTAVFVKPCVQDAVCQEP